MLLLGEIAIVVTTFKVVAARVGFAALNVHALGCSRDGCVGCTEIALGCT